MRKTYVEKEHVTHLRLMNNLGFDIELNDLVVISGMVGVADEYIKQGEVGSFHVEDGIILHGTGSDSFDTVGQSVYMTPSGELVDNAGGDNVMVGTVVVPKDGNGVFRFAKSKFAAVYELSEIANAVDSEGEARKAGDNAIVALGGRFFKKTVVLTSGAAATPEEVVGDEDVGEGERVYVLGVVANVDGSTAWDGDVTKVEIKDTDGAVAAEAAVADLDGNAVLGLMDLTLGEAVLKGTGLGEGKGLVVAGDDNGSAGDDLYITVFGTIA